MKQNTKTLIIDKAIELYNLHGYGSISMYEIAKSLSLSRGNVAYHFKDKDTLLTTINEQMWDQIEEKRGVTMTFPSFQNITEEMHKLYKLQNDYSFIFLDSKVHQHPSIKNKFREMSQKSILDFKTIIAFSIRIGNMKKEVYPGIYEQLAFTTWMISFFWLAQQTVQDDFSEKNVDKSIWSLIIPYLTERGIAALRKYMGEEFMYSIGPSFEIQFGENNQI